MKRKRPLGHDVVVTALLLLSCSDTHEKEIARDTTATFDTPVKAHVERATIEVTETAGCACTSGSGGRGAVPLPDCGRSHCTSSKSTDYRCFLFVDRDEVTAKIGIPCGDKGAADMLVDAKGERFAAHNERDWYVYAGGWDGVLLMGFDEKRAPLMLPRVDWNAIPSAREIVRAEVAHALKGAKYTEEKTREWNAKYFTNLEHVSGELYAEDLAEVSKSDVVLTMCRTKKTSWTDALEKAKPAVREQVRTRLGPGISSDDRRDVTRAVHVLDAKEILHEVGDPRKYLTGHPDRTLSAAAVLDAWSQTAPAPAAAHACKLIAAPVELELADAALTAIARAGLACPAVDTMSPPRCRGIPYIENIPRDATPNADTAFCEPTLAYVYAERLVKPQFDSKAFVAKCPELLGPSHDASSADDADTDD